MSRRYIQWAGYLFVCASFLFTGCQSSDQQILSPVLRLNAFCEPPSLDPRQASDITSLNLIKCLFEGVMVYNESNELAYGLAESVDVSNDGYIYTIHLKKTCWSNGDPLTSLDFIETWREMLDPSYPAPLAYHLFAIQNGKKIKEGEKHPDTLGVYYVDERCFKVKVEHPGTHFLEILAMPCTVPVHRATVKKNPQWMAGDPDQYVCNGPFTLALWEHHQEIVLSKNSRYHDKHQVHLANLHFLMISDQMTEEYLFDQGELDLIGSPYSKLMLESIPMYKKQGNLHSVLTNALYLYKLNTTVFPLTNTKLRKALSYAVDREEITQYVLGNQDLPAYGLIPSLPQRPQKTYFDLSYKEKAVQLFEEALEELELTKESFPKLTIHHNEGQDHKKIAEVIQEQWRQLFGIDIAVEVQEWKLHLRQLQSMEYEIGRQAWIGECFAPISYLEPYRYAFRLGLAGMNETGWESPHFSTLLNTLDFEHEGYRRSFYIDQAERIFMDEMPVIPLFFINYAYIKGDHVKGEFLSPLGFLNLKSARIERF